MGFLSRIFKGKKTKPTISGNNKKENADVPIRDSNTWPNELDEEKYDDGMTLK